MSTIVEECVIEYNQIIHSSTKFEPAYLLFGKKSVMSPIDIFNKDNIEEDRKVAQVNFMNNFEINKRRFDKNRITHKFQVGDQVYVENESKLNKKNK